MKPSIKIFILCVLSILMASCLSLNTTAITISHEVGNVATVSGQLYWRWYTEIDNSYGAWRNSSYTDTSHKGMSYISIRTPNNTNISNLQWGDYFTIPIWINLRGVNNQWNNAGFFNYSKFDTNCPIQDIDDTQVQNHEDSSGNTSQRHIMIITCKYIGSNSSDIISFNLGISPYNSGSVNVSTNLPSGYSHWRAKSQEDYSAALNTINSNIIANGGKLTQVKNAIDSMGSKLDDVNDNLSDIKSTQEQANQDAQDRYDQEKQEEQEREEQGQQDSSDAQGLFNFNVLNPFGHLWDLFNDDGCVSIPIIAGMVHSQNTVYCNWFDNSVRSVTTPVISIASAMLLFGFVVRWLSGNSGDIYGARNLNKELNG